MITPVVLSGGSGTRLWPLSRSACPKQFLPLMGGEYSLLQNTILRCSGIDDVQSPLVVCNEEHRFLVGEQLQAIDVGQSTILLEPCARDTAPAIALAALYLASDDPDALMLIMPADHNIVDISAFQRAVLDAKVEALKGAIITFGVVPSEPNTAYGYIKADADSTSKLSKVQAFREKPDAKTAKAYLSEGGYFWNAGIFMVTAQVYLAELEKHAPKILSASEKAIGKTRNDLDFLRVDKNAFSASPAVSIDYAVMEHTDRAMVIPLNAQWDDLGCWSALGRLADKDEHGNALYGDVEAHQTTNSTIYSQARMVATIGVSDLVIVETPDAVLVSAKESSQKVKELVTRLRAQGRGQADHNRKVYRPWGWYDSIEIGEGFQVKRIKLKPRARLSVQSHKYRAEHWVVLSGVARVLLGDDETLLNENQSTFIPIGAKHSLYNPSDTDFLEIIEVQTGSYLGEDDIVRFDDQYGRLEHP